MSALVHYGFYLDQKVPFLDSKICRFFCRFPANSKTKLRRLLLMVCLHFTWSDLKKSSVEIAIVKMLNSWFTNTFLVAKSAIFCKFQFYTEFADHVKTPWIPNYLKCKLLCSFNSNCTFLVHIRPLWEPF